MYDVVIIGAGVVGCAIARELSRFELDIALVEKEPDVAMGASKANSAIVHGGYAEPASTLKGRLCYQGRKEFARLNQELNFGFKPVGSHVLVFEEEQKAGLEQLLENGRLNGLDDLSILERGPLLEMEPNLNPDVKYSLYCAGAGVCSPYEMTIALAENAVLNGVDLYLNHSVEALENSEGSFTVHTVPKSGIKGRFVVNAAGLYAAEIANMAGDESFSIRPRSGEFILLNRGSGSLVNSVLFQMPTKMGKGILVMPTVYGNLLIGPDAIDEERNDLDTHVERLYHIWQVANRTTDKMDIQKFLRSYAGVRAVSDTDDFMIGPSSINRFINVAGIQSPGLTASPAIARMVRDLLKQQGLSMKKDPAFAKERKPTFTETAFMPFDKVQELTEKPEGDPDRMICRDEQVDEARIVDAMNRGISLTTPDAIKRRTRAGAGFCQGDFCKPRVLELMRHHSSQKIDERTDMERRGLTRVTRRQMLEYMKTRQE